MISDVRSFVLYWNTLFPIDLWWRIKHKAPFNSKSHREMCMVDMVFEYIEHNMLNAPPKKSDYTPGMGNWLIEREVPDEILQKEFDDLEVDDNML